jgi:mRNA interferase RelE/StbE
MKIELNNTAKKQLKRINEPYLNAIVAAIDKLEREPPEGAVKKLQGRDGFRLKEGGCRILFDIDKSGGRIDIFEITRRGQAYKKGTKR